MICEYTIRITGNQDILVLSPQIIGMLIEKIRCSDTKELIIPADELLPQGYAEYLERVMQTNNIEKNIGRQDAYDLTAKQIGMLKVSRTYIVKIENGVQISPVLRPRSGQTSCG